MNQSAYDHYLRVFNDRDYEAVLAHFLPDFEIRVTDQVRLRGRQQMLDFYAFLHAHVEERIALTRFATSDTLTAVEACVHLRCTRTLTAEALTAQGLHGMFPMNEGDVLAVPQYLHYHLEDGKVRRVVCLVVVD